MFELALSWGVMWALRWLGLFVCKENSGMSGKKSFKFDWNDILKHSKFNMLNYLDLSRLKSFSPFEKTSSDDPAAAAMSKSNSHSISQFEALKILAIEVEEKRSLTLVMEVPTYLLLFTLPFTQTDNKQTTLSFPTCLSLFLPPSPHFLCSSCSRRRSFL